MPHETLLDIAMTHANRLVEQARAGDEGAFNKLVSLWYKRIYNYGFKYAGSHDQAMEIAQNTFIRVHQKISQLNNVASFRPWLYRIAVNCCHAEARPKGNAGYWQDEPGTTTGHLQVADDLRYQPDAGLQRQELAEVVMAALQTLPDDQRQVVIMKEYEDLKFREIAEVLGISENTAKSRLYYGLRHLRQKLTKVINEH